MKTYLKDIIKAKQFDGVASNLHEAISYFNDLSADTNSFISFRNDNNDVLRFSWIAHQKWLVEYPVVTNQLHHQKYATQSECIALIHLVSANENFDNFDGFTEVPIKEFTLDEILEFKREDEYLLREEERLENTIATPKKNVPKPLKNNKPSAILGDVTVTEEELRTQTNFRVIDHKEQERISPLKKFKESAKHFEKEKKQVSIDKAPTEPILNDITKPEPVQNNTDTPLTFHSEKTEKTKKKNKPAIIMGEQLGSQNNQSPTSSQPKPKPISSNEQKPSSSDDDSFFSI